MKDEQKAHKCIKRLSKGENTRQKENRDEGEKRQKGKRRYDFTFN